MLRTIDDKCLGDGLAALRGPRTPRQHRNTLLTGDSDRDRGILAITRHDDAQGLDLIDRGIGAVAPAAERVEQHLAADLAT